MEVLEKNELAVIVDQSGLEQTKANFVLEKFQDYFKIASEWEAKAKTLTVTDESQIAEMKMAREARLFLKEKRIEVEKSRKELKEQSLREGKAIDGIANVLKALIEPTEKYLETQEKFAEIKAKERKEVLIAERFELLIPLIGEQANIYPLGEMTQPAFDDLLSGFKLQIEAKKQANIKADQERIAKEKAEAEEIERIRKENEAFRLKAVEQEKILAEERARAEKARLAAEAIAKVEREAADRLLEAQRKQAAAEKVKQDAILAKEREEKAKIEVELKAKKDAEVRAEKERLAELKAKEVAEAKAAKAPDKEKALKVIKSLTIEYNPNTFIKDEAYNKVAIDYIEEADLLMKKYIQKIEEL